MSELTALTIAEARDKLKAKAITATELTDAYLSAIDAANDAINAYVAVTHDQARSMAKASDERIAKGEAGALEGIPLGVKDLFATKGVHTQACSHILDGFKPEYESTVTANLWADGAVMLGKLNMDEFAMGSSNETSYYGPVKNPWRAKGSNADLVPGGSSGGSAAAVAAHLCAGATATDTGGSIRQPAAFTGTVGIKPTYGRVSRWGTVAFASSLDQAGPIARDVRDAAILMKSMASLDLKDTTSVDLPVPDYEAALGRSVKGMKIGIPREYRVDGMPGEIEELWQKGIQYLKDAGAEIVDISLPHTKYALPAYYIVAPAEASSNLARYDGVRYGLRVPGKDIADMYEQTRAAGFGKEAKRRIMIGTYVLSAGYYDAYYLRAQKVRTLIKKDFEDVFAKGVDAILTPATPSAAFGLADEVLANDPVKMYLNDIFTVTVNMAGLPGIAVPAGLNGQGLPLGLQLIGRPFEEETLFQAAHVIEQAAGRFTPAKWW
ncbi:glutamyl-tRNA(Gln) amidotransferase subunit A [Brucella ovis IntaBari-2006-46-332]|uniref:Glutamyl-tRNA(Gln) amidotransferase subunit A n=1 Tax=Brucella ovis (strain ATCC 25840 / 63/290 / NCTC 10512) TaxID=444178 RepID=GATA_BRUO2|nr:Asp-tRNA(Asn)/Glu-tRNA(Gln) amidotransferase subunit GatA [Brucella ovis]A5VUS6.1 RecName: Full=Glutamyl-tRNA(Gln) amidotransferase subunit A; Short=Glu-ADT subunit A [Brucella ovis ATCC 25840]ABQ62345.1 glutamyl-tRNA(Gln) amidotransferase, A subunit [Brucella ovis ATCC 25840]ENR00424.1 glutamyl-tRNA(Gln) amidotransferase subunit A [Brucella ovis 80/125]ENR05825.1 glutamyl-tRNA(Gln) amidotransferase subunit A [Brucella ovis F8/05B]ENS92210.1 glutamyl-tRNA(Gln) amidotransferase subunit A [Br